MPYQRFEAEKGLQIGERAGEVKMKNGNMIFAGLRQTRMHYHVRKYDSPDSSSSSKYFGKRKSRPLKKYIFKDSM